MSSRRGFTLLELFVVFMILSILVSILELSPDAVFSRHRMAVIESQKLYRWLTNRFQQSIMYDRPFYLKVYKRSSGGTVKIVWSQPVESEIYRIDSCFFSVNGSARKYTYNPYFRTLSPGVTVRIHSIYDDSDTVAKIVFPVKGFPRLELL